MLPGMRLLWLFRVQRVESAIRRDPSHDDRDLKNALNSAAKLFSVYPWIVNARRTRV
jgi:hypothetical protein